MSGLSAGDQSKNQNRPTTEAHVAEVRAGDRGGFAQLYERLAPSLEAWSLLRVSGALRDFVEPSDVVQEVWWRAMDAFDRFDPRRSSFRAWIFTIATNVLLEWNRKRRRRARVEPSVLFDRLASLPPELARQATSIGHGVALGESVKKLVELVQGIHEEDRKIFIHCGLEGLSNSEAGDLLGLSTEATKKRWQRLRQKLEPHPIWRDFDQKGFDD